MTQWRLEFSKRAAKTLDKLPIVVSSRILDHLEDVASSADPRQTGKALGGKLTGSWRYRIGDYRVICRIEASRLVVLVIEVGHRRDIYR